MSGEARLSVEQFRTSLHYGGHADIQFTRAGSRQSFADPAQRAA